VQSQRGCNIASHSSRRVVVRVLAASAMESVMNGWSCTISFASFDKILASAAKIFSFIRRQNMIESKAMHHTSSLFSSTPTSPL